MGGARIMQDMDEYYMRIALDLAEKAAQADCGEIRRPPEHALRAPGALMVLQ